MKTQKKQKFSEEIQNTIDILKRMGSTEEFSIGFCENCYRRTLHSRKNKNNNWRCTTGGCIEEVREKELIEEERKEKNNNYMRNYRDKKVLENLK